MTTIITILIIVLITNSNDLNLVSSLFHYITIIVLTMYQSQHDLTRGNDPLRGALLGCAPRPSSG